MRVPISRPRFEAGVMRRIERVLESGMIAQGKEVAKFERQLAKFLHVKDAVTVNSGTTALHLALISAGIGRGDEVVVPSFSFIATANAVLYVGAKPVFADIDKDILTLSPKTVEPLVSPKTKAVIMVSLYGTPAYTDEMANFCRRHNLVLVEDAAQSLGAKFGGRMVGSFGLGCFSFYATKNVTTGEGGAVAVNKEATGKLLRSLRNHGNSGGDYEYDKLGYNARLTEFQAVLGQEQLKALPQSIRRRRQRARLLLKTIKNPAVQLPVDVEGHSWHQFTIRSSKRDNLQRMLNKHGFEAKIYYPIPIHLQPVYRKLEYDKINLPETEAAVREVLSLPIHPGVSFADIKKMARIINDYE